MATEYKLSYTASEIDRMLGEVDKPKSFNDLTDKPFGVTQETVQVLNRSTFISTRTRNGICQFLGASVLTPLKQDVVYDIIINEQKYTTTAIYGYTEFSGEAVYIGNSDTTTLDGGLPFYISYSDTNDRIYILWKETFGKNIILEISEREIIEQLDEKFIPDTVATKEYADSVMQSSDGTKYFYQGKGLVEIYDLSYTVNPDITMSTSIDTALELGKKYKIVVNGAEYITEAREMTCTDLSTGVEMALYIGNATVVAGTPGLAHFEIANPIDSGEPIGFSMSIKDGKPYGSVWHFAPEFHNATVSTQIYECDFDVLNEEFLPETVALKSDIEEAAEKFMPLLTSPNGTKYKLSVADDGTLSAVAVE